MIEPIEGSWLKGETSIPYSPDAVLDIVLATGRLRPIQERYNSITITENEVTTIKGKLGEAYPKVFSPELKKRGRYFPLPIPPQTDTHIREQIVGDAAMSLKDEIRFVKAVGLKDGERVLDVGAGFGRTSILLAEQANNIHILSIDVDEAKVELLKSVLPKYRFNDGELGTKKITAVVGNATDLHQEIPSEEKFDVVVIKDIIGLLGIADLTIGQNEKGRCVALADNLRIFALKVKPVLKEGGRVVIWDGDLTTQNLLDTLEVGMYLEGFNEKERSSLIKFQLGKPPQDVQASFGIFFYEPNDEFLRILRRVYC